MKFNKTILPSGLRVVTVPMADNPSVTVLVLVEAGSEYEATEQNGISHFLEHMIFKGTAKRPNADGISRELDGLGAQSNAFTSQEFTGFYAKADSRHFAAILDIIADMYQNPLFREKDIEKEKGVIVEEIRMYNDLPQAHVRDAFTKLMYGDQPAGWNIIGTEGSVRSFSRHQLAVYRSSHYVAAATTVIVAGSIKEAEAVKKAETAFAGLSREAKKVKPAVRQSQSAPAIAVAPKETDQTHLVIGVRAYPLTDPRMPELNVLASILGGGMSSRLFSRMRTELGICYYVRASPNPYIDYGDLTISAGVDSSRVAEGIKGILAECARLKSEPVPPAELKKAKDYIAGNTLLELETSDSRAEFFGIQEALKGKIESPDEAIRKMNAVSAEDVQKLAREIFVDEGLNMALVGKFKDDTAFRPYFKF